MNRPSEALLDAFLEDLREPVRRLRERGWPAEVVVVNEDGWFGVRVETKLDGPRVPVEAVGGPDVSVGYVRSDG